MTERQRIEQELFHTYQRINRLLFVNETTEANKILRDEIPELERQKTNLRYIEERQP